MVDSGRSNTDEYLSRYRKRNKPNKLAFSIKLEDSAAVKADVLALGHDSLEFALSELKV